MGRGASFTARPRAPRSLERPPGAVRGRCPSGPAGRGAGRSRRRRRARRRGRRAGCARSTAGCAARAPRAAAGGGGQRLVERGRARAVPGLELAEQFAADAMQLGREVQLLGVGGVLQRLVDRRERVGRAPDRPVGQRQSEPELREVRRRSRRPPCAQAVLDRRDGLGIAAEALGDLEVRHPGRQPAREAELPGHLDHATGVPGRDTGLPGDLEQLGGERVGVGAREMRRRAIQCLGRRDRVADRSPGGGEVTEQPLRHGQVGAGADARVMGEQRVGRIPPPTPLQKRDASVGRPSRWSW